MAALCWPAAGDQNVFTVTPSFGWDSFSRPMEWTPVYVTITSNLTEPFEGVLSLSAQQDGLNNLTIRHEFVLTPGVRLCIPLITKFAYTADSCTLRITTPRGGRVWSESYDLWDLAQNRQILHSLDENDMLIGLVGKRRFGVLRLEEQSACRYGESVGKVYVKDKLPAQLPWDWTGYCGLDILILYDADLGQCNASQLKAIEQWVRNGGRALIILSANPLARDDPLRSCLPFEILESRQHAVSEAVADELKLPTQAAHQVIAWPVQVCDSAFCDFLGRSEDTALFAVGYCGFGRVGVLSFDPSTIDTSARAETAAFWINAISSVMLDPAVGNLRQSPAHPSGVSVKPVQSARPYELQAIDPTSVREIVPAGEIKDDNSSYPYRYGISLEQAASNSVMEYLLSIPQMRPLSIWWVILLLVLLALLLGPVDYIVLKKLDKQPLTWLTCTFWIVLFTVGAYYGVQALRSGQLQYRSLTVTDSIAADGVTWSATHAGLFASKSDRYTLEGLDTDQWWSAISPEQRQIYFHSGRNATRNVYCRQRDGANVPDALPVNIWTMQCLLCEEPHDSFPLRATVKKKSNGVQVSISNLSDTPVERGYVLLSGDQVFEFGRVEPISTREFEGRCRTAKVWESNIRPDYEGALKYDRPILTNEEACSATGSFERTRTLRAMVQRGAAVVCVQTHTENTAVRVKDKTCEYSDLNLRRLVVFPEQL
jgi:hypothetical protein